MNFCKGKGQRVSLREPEPLTQGSLVAVILWKHAHQKVKMVIQEAEANDFGKIDQRKVHDQGLQTVLILGFEKQSGKDRTGNDVVGSWKLFYINVLRWIKEQNLPITGVASGYLHLH